jgi:hypothetical protein
MDLYKSNAIIQTGFHDLVNPFFRYNESNGNDCDHVFQNEIAVQDYFHLGYHRDLQQVQHQDYLHRDDRPNNHDDY